MVGNTHMHADAWLYASELVKYAPSLLNTTAKAREELGHQSKPSSAHSAPASSASWAGLSQKRKASL